MIDLEGDLEELHESEQRWAAKQKRAIEQVRSLRTKSKNISDLCHVVYNEHIPVFPFRRSSCS